MLSDTFPERPVRLYHHYDKGRERLPDGRLERFAVRDGRATFDRTIELPR